MNHSSRKELLRERLRAHGAVLAIFRADGLLTRMGRRMISILGVTCLASLGGFVFDAPAELQQMFNALMFMGIGASAALTWFRARPFWFFIETLETEDRRAYCDYIDSFSWSDRIKAVQEEAQDGVVSR